MVTPNIPKDLMEYLQKVFPNTLPESPIGSDALGVLIGQQKVINHLQAQFKAQNRAVLTVV